MQTLIQVTPQSLRELRIKLKLTQAQMGEKLGITASAIAHIESGKHKISKQTEMLCKQLEVLKSDAPF